MGAPALVLVAHGTRSAAGVRLIAELAEAVRRRLPGTLIRIAFVDVLGPAPSEVLRDLAAESIPAVVVPAFLASGFHVFNDVPREISAGEHPSVTVTPALGPDPALAQIQAQRLHRAGWHPGDAVVLAAAGSSDPRARQDLRRATTLLARCLNSPVHLANIATGTPTVTDVVAALRPTHPRTHIAAYLLSHGLFHQRLHEVGAHSVTAPLGPHPAVVNLITTRYRPALHQPIPVRA
ncbi:sirohydrochlorin chelatase [Nocardia panacis]|uniref:Sirohydrochlorin chelatase n=1 Tax=Nocardia panacis TaxID=2340916 RepID=A0A3A4KTP6_9NOCA|nr:sirohydrochlorin chelatase [Nocardia panacis]RJO79917.1 sirohydrochlorin chelatase [Nocardia panacis]